MKREGAATGGNEDAPRVWAEVDEIVRLREQVKLQHAELARLREDLAREKEHFHEHDQENARLREELWQSTTAAAEAYTQRDTLLAALRPFVKQCGKVIVKDPQEGYAIIIYGQDVYDARAAIAELEEGS